MWIADRFRYLLIVSTVVLGVIGLILPFMASITDDAVKRTTRHDVAWTASNARIEIGNLARAVLAGLPDEAAVQLDVINARIETWNAGSFREFADADPARRKRVDDIARLVGALGDMIPAVDTPAVRARAVTLIERIDPLVDRLSGEAMSVTNAQLAENRDRLNEIERAERFIMVALLSGGVLLMLMSGLQNRALKQAMKAEKDAAAKFEFAAAHDILTGLPNRGTLRVASERALQRYCWADRQAGRSIAILLLDLDGFKPINDTLGHVFGDGVLISTAERLLAATRSIPGAVAARLGGDEFTVLLTEGTRAHEALGFAHRLHELLRAPYSIDGIPLTVDVSIGLAVVSEEGVSADTLMRRADLALNQAKARGKGFVLEYRSDMEDDITRRRVLEAELAQAVARDEFEPFYQPVTDMASGQIVSVEALVRWRHPVRGLLLPGEFIPVAEASGHIVDIGRIVLEKACRDAVAFAEPIPVAVNLSTVQLMRVDIPAIVAEVLARTGLQAERLKLEITESVMVSDEARTRKMIRQVRALGVTVSLDDFGTGYSSLSYLRGFGFDELKIDRSFVVAMNHDPQSTAIVQAIVTLARSLGLRIIAEGIETEEQAALVMACGCSRGQGYLYSRPVTAGALEAMLGKAPAGGKMVA